MKKSYRDKIFDESIKKAESSERLRKYPLSLSALSSILGPINEDIIKSGASKRLIELSSKLTESILFFEKKSPTNGNLPNLYKEKTIAGLYSVDLKMNKVSVDEVNKWIDQISTKYGYQI
jgi:hypothetical protein